MEIRRREGLDNEIYTTQRKSRTCVLHCTKRQTAFRIEASINDVFMLSLRRETCNHNGICIINSTK